MNHRGSFFSSLLLSTGLCSCPTRVIELGDQEDVMKRKHGCSVPATSLVLYSWQR